eukprot:CAMPEP_0205822034 /NCGR_PEP_ID=MMETSP0206-20130828/10817_1 /ASSEMBLY_ACC=CAM_ASM_000279 /TAXON_ID=36767 /ORGANISM="Euplotes focardii, Strain TN1" /LENGTH=228 /DNA_ID=CAMNT_0053117971 /DNA_START=1 /DNA_END=687 /DNA_ORIENTATION=+
MQLAHVVGVLMCLVKLGSAGNAAGIAFLKENANKEGVITLASGMQYKVLRKGHGAFHPTPDSSCKCHYHGTLIDGTTFDSSYDRGSPSNFAPNQVIKGWTEAMQLMVEGDQWEMYIPSELGYGERGSPPKIAGGDTLIFKMEIIEIEGDKVPAITCDPETAEGCNEKETKFIEKIKAKAWGLAEVVKEQARLTGMKAKKMKPELLGWLNRRMNILGKLKETFSTKEDL